MPYYLFVYLLFLTNCLHIYTQTICPQSVRVGPRLYHKVLALLLNSLTAGSCRQWLGRRSRGKTCILIVDMVFTVISRTTNSPGWLRGNRLRPLRITRGGEYGQYCKHHSELMQLFITCHILTYVLMFCEFIICTWCRHQRESGVFTLTSSSGHIVTAHRHTSAFLAAGEWQAMGRTMGRRQPSSPIQHWSLTKVQWQDSDRSPTSPRAADVVKFSIIYTIRGYIDYSTVPHSSVSLAVITTTSRRDCHYAQKLSGLTSHTKNPPNTRP